MIPALAAVLGFAAHVHLCSIDYSISSELLRSALYFRSLFLLKS